LLDEPHDVYFPPFKAAVDAGAGSLMTAYADLDDVPATGNTFPPHDMSRRVWGVKVAVDVRDTGMRPGDEVVQLYVHQRSGSASRPGRELKGFERVTLALGETKTVEPAFQQGWVPGLGQKLAEDGA